MEFKLVESDQPVVGFVYALGAWNGEEAISGLVPLYDAVFDADKRTVVARPGYAVAGIDVDAAEYVLAIRVVFMRIDPNGRLQANDAYKSDWIGRPRGTAPKLLGGDGSRVVGVYGRGAAVLDAIGLVIE
ncbi:MAG: hypothetical protein ACLQNE_15135 [Thermoguttaceae bacterium]